MHVYRIQGKGRGLNRQELWFTTDPAYIARARKWRTSVAVEVIEAEVDDAAISEMGRRHTGNPVKLLPSVYRRLPAFHSGDAGIVIKIENGRFTSSPQSRAT